MGGRLSGRTAARLILLAAAGIGLLLFTLWLNRVEIVPLISREGQTFEKAVVTQILQDNRTETGTRVGEQVVEVKLLTGEKKGELLEVTSSAGFLFGAPCTPGHAGWWSCRAWRGGYHHRQRLFPGQGMGDLPVRHSLSGSAGSRGRKAGREGRHRPRIHLFFHPSVVSSHGLPGLFPVLVGGVHLHHHGRL